jgi:hypothetical protein
MPRPEEKCSAAISPKARSSGFSDGLRLLLEFADQVGSDLISGHGVDHWIQGFAAGGESEASWIRAATASICRRP